MDSGYGARLRSWVQSRSLGGIFVASCLTIVLLLTGLIALTAVTVFQSSMEEAVHVQTRELSAQIVYNYENYISSIIGISNTVQTDVDHYVLRDAAHRSSFSDYLAQVVHFNSDFLKIAVYDSTTGECYASSAREEVGGPFPREDVQWFHDAKREPTVHLFSAPYAEEGGAYRVNVSKLIQIENGGTPAVLKIEVSFQRFIDLVERSNLGDMGRVTILDDDYDVVYSSLPQGGGAGELDVVRRLVLGSRNTFLDGHYLNVYVDTLTNTEWRICVFINVDRLSAIRGSFLTTILAVSATVLIAGAFLILSLARWITNPMKRLERAMEKIEMSDYFHTEQVALTASREVAALNRRFNRMMEKISELMTRVIEEQNARRTSELKALQNQINPHFLYNTLDAIVWLIEKEKNSEAGEMVVALSRLFRISISKGREVITVREELEHVRSYLLIQSIRYADAFEYEFEVDDTILEAQTMKLILQPLVENCLYHGLKNKVEHGKIKISAHRENDTLLLSVTDNGYGMRPETAERLRRSFEEPGEGEGVGLKNIYRRVTIYYGECADMEIDSVLDEGTTITIKEPLNWDE